MAKPNIEVNALITSQFVDASLWIPMEVDQPKNLQKVLVVLQHISSGSKYVTIAQYTDGYGMEVSEQLDDGTWGEYNEQDDACYCPKGFYQDCNMYQEICYQICEAFCRISKVGVGD